MVKFSVLFKRFLLGEEMEDTLEEYFGNQRKQGRRSDNPDIRIQKSISCQRGNTRGRKDKSKAWVNVTDDPVPRKKSKAKEN